MRSDPCSGSDRGPRHRRSGALGLPRLLALLALPFAWAGSCVPTLEDPLGIGPSMAPFERHPYVQRVDSGSASIVWLARADVGDSAAYRVVEGAGADPDPDWRGAPVRRLEYPDTVLGEQGRLVRREARLEGLPPGAEVEYVAWAGEARQGPFRFRTAPPAGEGDTIRVLAFGDSGWGSEAQLRLARLMSSEPADLIVHTGDIAYHVGSEEDFTLRHFRVYRSLLAGTPFFPAPGNHDLRTDDGAPYDRAFLWPAPTEGARYYTFRWGGVQFVMLDTTDPDRPDLDYPPRVAARLAREAAARTSGEDVDREESPGGRMRDEEGPEFEWLVRTLEQASADPSVRWIVVVMHHPIYSHAVGLSGHGADQELGEAIVPLFDRYGVDLVLAGHDHHYERSHPLRDGRAVEPGCGPVYVVSGGGGATRFARGIAPSPLLERSSREHHYVRLKVVEAAIIGEVVDEAGRLIDEFRVFDSPGWSQEEEAAAPSQCDD